MEAFEGQILANKYRVERVLGRGGMGVVVAARHLKLGERVALKFLLPEALGNLEAVARFEREARAAARIKSEHVARVSDVGTLDGGAPYIVMEYLEGLDLARWLVQRGPLPVEQAVEFVLQAGEAVAEAHTLGIVHRDLKPANLFIVERPDGALDAKVLDFGISKTSEFGSSASGMTKTSTSMGSPLYMSPEQLQSAKDVDLRGDIWALGVVLYELVSGRTPFPGETMAALVLRVISAPPAPLMEAPPGFEAVVFKCLEKDRAARYQTLAELAVALQEFAPRRAVASVERIGRLMARAGMSAILPDSAPAPAKDDAHSTQPRPSWHGTAASWTQTNPPGDRRRRAILIAAAVIAVAIFGVGAAALLRAGAPSATLATATTGLPSVDGGMGSAQALPIAPPLAAIQRVPTLADGLVASASPPASAPAPGTRAAGSGAASDPKRAPSHFSRPSTPVPARSGPMPVATPPAPPIPAKNPLKMSIQ
jgi:hypothetical protein